VAQLVEHHLAKVRVAGSNPVVRSRKFAAVIIGVRRSTTLRVDEKRTESPMAPERRYPSENSSPPPYIRTEQVYIENNCLYCGGWRSTWWIWMRRCSTLRALSLVRPPSRTRSTKPCAGRRAAGSTALLRPWTCSLAVTSTTELTRGVDVPARCLPGCRHSCCPSAPCPSGPALAGRSQPAGRSARQHTVSTATNRGSAQPQPAASRRRSRPHSSLGFE